MPIGEHTTGLGQAIEPAVGPSAAIRRELRFVLTRPGTLIAGVTALTAARSPSAL